MKQKWYPVVDVTGDRRNQANTLIVAGEDPTKLHQDSWYTETKEQYCFKTLRLGIICYAAIW